MMLLLLVALVAILFILYERSNTETSSQNRSSVDTDSSMIDTASLPPCPQNDTNGIYSSDCELISCNAPYKLGRLNNVATCSLPGAICNTKQGDKNAIFKYNGDGNCQFWGCKTNFVSIGQNCHRIGEPCLSPSEATYRIASNGKCVFHACKDGYILKGAVCVTPEPPAPTGNSTVDNKAADSNYSALRVHDRITCAWDTSVNGGRGGCGPDGKSKYNATIKGVNRPTCCCKVDPSTINDRCLNNCTSEKMCNFKYYYHGEIAVLFDDGSAWSGHAKHVTHIGRALPP